MRKILISLVIILLCCASFSAIVAASGICVPSTCVIRESSLRSAQTSAWGCEAYETGERQYDNVPVGGGIQRGDIGVFQTWTIAQARDYRAANKTQDSCSTPDGESDSQQNTEQWTNTTEVDINWARLEATERDGVHTRTESLAYSSGSCGVIATTEEQNAVQAHGWSASARGSLIGQGQADSSAHMSSTQTRTCGDDVTITQTESWSNETRDTTSILLLPQAAPIWIGDTATTAESTSSDGSTTTNAYRFTGAIVQAGPLGRIEAGAESNDNACAIGAEDHDITACPAETPVAPAAPPPDPFPTYEAVPQHPCLQPVVC